MFDDIIFISYDNDINIIKQKKVINPRPFFGWEIK